MTITTTHWGKRRIDKMLKEWNTLRKAISSGDIEAAQDAFDKCENWIDFAFGAKQNDD